MQFLFLKLIFIFVIIGKVQIISFKTNMLFSLLKVTSVCKMSGFSPSVSISDIVAISSYLRSSGSTQSLLCGVKEWYPACCKSRQECQGTNLSPHGFLYSPSARTWSPQGVLLGSSWGEPKRISCGQLVIRLPELRQSKDRVKMESGL
jgi:hypothetical protein